MEKMVQKKFKYRKGDLVQVLSGDDKGKTGIIKSVLRSTSRVIVEGVNIVKKSVKRSKEHPEGAILKVEKPIHLSNVAAYSTEKEKSGRVGYRIEDGKKCRYIKSTDEVI